MNKKTSKKNSNNAKKPPTNSNQSKTITNNLGAAMRESTHLKVQKRKRSPEFENARRSTRHRIQPLKYWENEYIDYKITEEGFVVNDIVHTSKSKQTLSNSWISQALLTILGLNSKKSTKIQKQPKVTHELFSLKMNSKSITPLLLNLVSLTRIVLLLNIIVLILNIWKTNLYFFRTGLAETSN